MQASQRLPLQRRITLNVLAVLIQSGGTDALRVDKWKEVAASGVTPGLPQCPKLCCGMCQRRCPTRNSQSSLQPPAMLPFMQRTCSSPRARAGLSRLEMSMPPPPPPPPRPTAPAPTSVCT